MVSPQCWPTTYPCGPGDKGQCLAVPQRCGWGHFPASLASLHALCPDLAQVNLPVTHPVSCLCWSIIRARDAVMWGSHVGSDAVPGGAGGVGGQEHSEGSAHTLQPGPAETTTLQLSGSFSWPGAHVALGVAAMTAVLPGWVQVTDLCLAARGWWSPKPRRGVWVGYREGA